MCRDQVHAIRILRPDRPVTAFVLNDRPADVANDEWRSVHARGFSGNRYAFVLGSIWGAARSHSDLIILGHRNLLPLALPMRMVAPGAQIWVLLHGTDAWHPLSRSERVYLRSVTRVFAVSPHTAKLFRAAGCASDIGLWPNGMPHSWILPDPASPAFQKPYALLAVGRIDPLERQKGLDHTIEAVALLAKGGLDFTLTVVGDGRDRRRLEEFANAQGVGSRVFFRGQLDDEELRTCYRRCDVFVLPSAQEGFGIVYLEAMAYAKPVVAADAAGAPFVVRPGVSGFLVPYGDPATLATCLKQIVSDPQASRDLGMRARAFLEQTFSSERYVLATQDHLREAHLLCDDNDNHLYTIDTPGKTHDD